MNHFPFHIGDYAEATGHLSFIEDATYFRCIRKYYSTEKALPREISQVQRLIGAKTKEEKNSVEVVLNEFFILEEDGWHNKRCDQELEKYQEGSKEDQEKKEHEKERLRRYREERSLMFTALRAVGVVPKWDVHMDTLRDLFNKNCNAPVLSTVSVQSSNCNALDTHTDTAITNQEPITTNHIKNKSITPPVGVDVNVWNDFVSHRKNKKSPISATALKGIESEAVKANMTLQAALALCVMRGWTGFKAEWVAEKPQASSSYDRKMKTLSGLTGGIHGSSSDAVFKPITETKTIDMESPNANLLG